MKNIPDYLYATSYYQPFSIVFKFEQKLLTIENFPAKYKKGKILLEIVNFELDSVLKEEIEFAALSKGISLNLPKNNLYFIRIYTPSKTLFIYESLLFKSDVPFYYKDGKCRFIKTIVYDANKEFYDKIPIYTSNVPKDQRLRIQKFAQKLTQNCKTDYERILQIHDWIAENIYYDFDALESDENRRNCPIKPLDVLENKRSICQGITDLSVELLRSVGIHSLGLISFALGIDTEGGWENNNNIKAEANHIFTAAYCNNRWILLDITWDCENEYKKGKYIKSENPTSHKYFDMTLEFLSNTHRLDKIQ